MGFFNDLGKKTTETTSKIAKEAKCKLKINENKGKIDDLYKHIGQHIYEGHVNNEEADITEIEAICKEVDELSKEIEDTKKEILLLNHKKICEKCSAEMEEDAMFCPKCGDKQNFGDNTGFGQEDAKEVEVLPKDE